jgi:hypothetical protein
MRNIHLKSHFNKKEEKLLYSEIAGSFYILLVIALLVILLYVWFVIIEYFNPIRAWMDPLLILILLKIVALLYIW